MLPYEITIEILVRMRCLVHANSTTQKKIIKVYQIFILKTKKVGDMLAESSF